jgi:hypothetical protein
MKSIGNVLLEWIDDQLALAEVDIKPEFDSELSLHIDRLIILKEDLLGKTSNENRCAFEEF